ncbi:hypothetical protein [Methylophilus aquaticus]|uniref:MxaA protein n=1 Tax=Methylophilus aquaticus TaxID=1971610 RepID=A0ABT9JTM0_9PROT|nr:hypothetical protein [Methylophilus aquaticus]MDP8567491.1 hypothetical protein [Methylophilus aquaticus]
MKTLFTRLLFCLGLSAASYSLCAATPAATMVALKNPAHYSGIQIGDVLQRTITIAVEKPYQLVRTRLPIKGLNRQGIELRDIEIESTQAAGKTVYQIAFSYQVFANTGKPIQLQLPAERIQFSGGPTDTTITMPSWRFWFAALLPDKLLKAKASVIPQYKPSLLDHTQFDRWLLAGLLSMLTGLAGLLYVNAAGANWLPWMNGAFARASRQISKLPATADGQKQAALLLQQAFNTSWGVNVLTSNVSELLTQRPHFQPLEAEIKVFFTQASALLYAGQSGQPGTFLSQMNTLCRQLRDCERGAR